MAEYKLKLEKREATGKKSAGLRAEGMIPSVVYGAGEPMMTASEYIATEKVLAKAGYHSPIDLDIDGKKKIAVVKTVQKNPVSRRIMNVEFQAVSRNAVVEATTPIVVVGFEESEAAKTYHFAVNNVISEIVVKAKPADLPKELEVDASGLETIEDKLTIADIKLPEGVEFADKELDPAKVVVSLFDPVAEAEKREAEAKAEEAEAGAGEAEAESESGSESEPAEAKTEDAPVEGGANA